MDKSLSVSFRRVAALLIAASLLLGAGVSVPAFDWGGNLNSSTSVRNEEAYDDQTEQVFNEETFSLWVQGDFGSSHSYEAQGSYQFTTERPYLFDVDILNVEGNYNLGESRRLVTHLGRFHVSDPTGYVLSHRIDGGEMAFKYPGTLLTLSAGYTGLLLKPTADISMSQTDLFESNDNDMFLAPPRLVGRADVSFPDLFPGHTIYVSFVFQEDLRPDSDVAEEGREEQSITGGGRVDSQYATVGASGSLSSRWFYDIFGTFEGGQMLSYVEDDASDTNFEYRNKPILAYMFGGAIRFYYPDALASQAGLRTVLTSGDSDHTAVVDGNTENASTMFRPIGTSTNTPVFSPGFGNLFFSTLYYSLKPFDGHASPVLDNIQTGLETSSFFRTSTGPVDAAGADQSSDALYLGTEVDLRVNFRPFSDLGAGLVSGLFFPNGADDGPFFEDERSARFLTKLDVSFSF